MSNPTTLRGWAQLDATVRAAGCPCCATYPQAHNNRPCSVCGHWTDLDTGMPAQTPGQQAQAQFEALFDHTPMVDTRTPADIRNGVTLAQAQARNTR
jgi:hypothetical protein